jgi:hypothetical protein
MDLENRLLVLVTLKSGQIVQLVAEVFVDSAEDDDASGSEEDKRIVLFVVD